jgi:putative membrane protein
MDEMIAQCTEMMLQMNGMMSGMGSMVGGGMRGGMTTQLMAPWWILAWALVIAVAAALVLAVVWAVRRPSTSVQTGETPTQILKRRYARGEISSEQFEAMRQQVSGD